MKPTLLVLAAGMGSRYGGLKQMDPVGPSGETILDYSVFDAISAGFNKVIFIIRPDFESEFREKVARKFSQSIQVDYVYQTLDQLPNGFVVPSGREKPWGTTHAILCARQKIQVPFAVINADDFYGRESYAVLGNYLSNQINDSIDFSMVGFTLKNTLSEFGTVARGVCRTDTNHHLTDIQELTKIKKTISGAEHLDENGLILLNGDEAVSMNMWGFTPSLFSHLEAEFRDFLVRYGKEMKSESYIPISVGNLIRTGKATCRVLRTSSTWCGVTYKEDKLHVQSSILEKINSGEYPANLWK